MRRFDVVCGGVASAANQAATRVVHLDVQGEARNVNLKIEDITRAMVANLPDVLLDLLEVGAYIYCADQRVSRGSDMLTDYGRDWRRQLHFTIPLRRPDLWEDPEVKEPLREVLGFLSEDTYHFSFVEAEKPMAQKEMYFPNLLDAAFQPDEVALFSGGIDSFAGAVEDLVKNRKALALVGHHSATQVFNVQKELVHGLKKGGLDPQLFYVPVNVTNTGVRATEFTQRTRSFLFACLGLVVARMFGRDRITFYENGVISINLPLAGDVVGARATRSTHPKVLRGLETVFSLLLDRQIQIRSPFQWYTKKEVTSKIPDNGFAHLLASTVSCTRSRHWTKEQRHCGACSQCIDRRFAVLAAGLEEWDPSKHYMLDLLLGDRSSDQDIRMAIAYVKFFQALAPVPRSRFLAVYPQIASSLRWFAGLSTDEAKDQIYDLVQRHAQDVLSVIAEGTARHMEALVRGELPSGSLLAMCFSRSRIEVAPPSDYDRQVKDFLDNLAAPRCEFAVDHDAERILFRGDFYLEGANFKLVDALLGNFRAGKRPDREIAYFYPADLAAELKITEASLRQQVTRLRKLVAERLAVDLGVVLNQDDFIENKERAGYRLCPRLREVSPADL